MMKWGEFFCFAHEETPAAAAQFDEKEKRERERERLGCVLTLYWSFVFFKRLSLPVVILYNLYIISITWLRW